MNVREFRDALEATLSTALGSYTLPNGSVTPAIAVRSYGEALPAGTTASGIEAVVIRDPMPIPVRQYRQEQTLSEWSVFLINWGNGSAELSTVASLVAYDWPGTVMSPIQAQQGLGPRSLIRLTIRDYVTAAPMIAPAAPPQNLTTISGLNLTTILGIPLVTLP